MSGLPFLPGNSFRDASQTNFPRAQTLSVRSDGNDSVRDPRSVGTVVEPEPPVSSVVDASKPGWLQFDRVCLRFDAYFQEEVVERQDENHRIRACKILFYPEDDSIQVNEDKQANSGMRQGTLIRRCKIPKAGQSLECTSNMSKDSYFGVNDFNVGVEVTLFGHTFKITDCDGFTRKFLTNMGIVVEQPESTPNNPHTELSMTARMRETNPGRPYEVHDTLKQYLDYDRKVLRFYAYWDDTTSMFGDQRFMILHYFLANDTCELVEVLPANSGRTGNGVFFRRNKLPKESGALVKLPGQNTQRTVLNVHGVPIGGKNRHLLDSLRTGAPNDEFYDDQDLQIGATFEVLGRHFVICDCDDFTRDHYKRKFGLEMSDPIDVTAKAAEPLAHAVPPPTGFGTEEDSMVSVQRLVLQAPKKEAGKHMPKVATPADGSYILRFSAVFKDQSDLMKGRQFIIMYYLEDDTIGIQERGVRNSGIRAGKFLQRGRFMTADNSRKLALSDFSINPGSEITINKFEFVIDGADQYAIDYMSQQPQ